MYRLGSAAVRHGGTKVYTEGVNLVSAKQLGAGKGGGRRKRFLRRSLAGRNMVFRGGKSSLSNSCSISHRSANMARPAAVHSTGIMQ